MPMPFIIAFGGVVADFFYSLKEVVRYMTALSYLIKKDSLKA